MGFGLGVSNARFLLGVEWKGTGPFVPFYALQRKVKLPPIPLEVWDGGQSVELPLQILVKGRIYAFHWPVRRLRAFLEIPLQTIWERLTQLPSLI